MQAHQENMNLISNNMANVNTVGFKGQRTSFTDLVYQNINRPTAENPATIGHGVRINTSDLVMAQGPLSATNRFLDFALTQPGEFFAVQNMSGDIQYTRSGNFMLSHHADGNFFLAAANGDMVLDSDQNPIRIEFEQVQVHNYVFDSNGDHVLNPDGSRQYTISYADGPPIIDMDAIGIFRFDNPYGLVLMGENRFVATDLSGQSSVVEGVRGIRGGSLEGSNVEIATEMVRVIEASRAFSFNSRMIQVADEVEQTVNNLR